MTSPAAVARPDGTVVEAARTMERGRVERLPVADGSGRLIGVVSRADLLRAFLRISARSAGSSRGWVWKAAMTRWSAAHSSTRRSACPAGSQSMRLSYAVDSTTTVPVPLSRAQAGAARDRSALVRSPSAHDPCTRFRAPREHRPSGGRPP